jgi:hypothetical protein
MFDLQVLAKQGREGVPSSNQHDKANAGKGSKRPRVSNHSTLALVNAILKDFNHIDLDRSVPVLLMLQAR